jgi:hypothetical protein
MGRRLFSGRFGPSENAGAPMGKSSVSGLDDNEQTAMDLTDSNQGCPLEARSPLSSLIHLLRQLQCRQNRRVDHNFAGHGIEDLHNLAIRLTVE